MSAHTKGPWKADITREPEEFAVIVGVGGASGTMVVAEIATGINDKWTPEDEANARLIAAAPELLAALRELLALGQQESIEDGELEAAQKAARAAIKKAVQP